MYSIKELKIFLSLFSNEKIKYGNCSWQSCFFTQVGWVFRSTVSIDLDCPAEICWGADVSVLLHLWWQLFRHQPSRECRLWAAETETILAGCFRFPSRKFVSPACCHCSSKLPWKVGTGTIVLRGKEGPTWVLRNRRTRIICSVLEAQS